MTVVILQYIEGTVNIVIISNCIVNDHFFHVGVGETWLKLLWGQKERNNKFIDITLLFLWIHETFYLIQ